MNSMNAADKSSRLPLLLVPVDRRYPASWSLPGKNESCCTMTAEHPYDHHFSQPLHISCGVDHAHGRSRRTTGSQIYASELSPLSVEGGGFAISHGVPRTTEQTRG